MRISNRIFALSVTLAMALGLGAAGAPVGKVGLVLSGGGAKGVAHIGVIQAFEDNCIPIDYVTGTSMGAIVGSLYASGFTPAEMLALIASPGFADWSTGRIDPDYLYYFLSEPQTPSLVRVNLGRDSAGVAAVLPMSLINPIPMNMAFPGIYSRYTAQCGGDFDRLFLPFRCVTSDIYAKHKVVLSHGSLADAVRMSMSFPMVFEPIELDGVPMYDGGIYDNYPVDVMVDDFDPRWIIGVNVGSKNAPPTSRSPMGQLEDMIMQPAHYPFPEDRGVDIRIDLDQFSLLDFGKYRQIYDIGYRRGLEMIDSIRAKVPVRADSAAVAQRRRQFKQATRPMRIGRVSVTGGTPAQNAYLESLFTPPDGCKALTYSQARDAYYRAVSLGKLQNLVPTPVYNPADSTFTLNYRAVVKEDYTLGIGGYVSSSTTSMLFCHTGYHSLGFNALNANLNGWLGQSYMGAEAELKWYLPTSVPSALTLRGVGSRLKYHETEKLFYEVTSPDFIRKSEAYVRGVYSMGPSLRTRLDLHAGWGHLTDRYNTGLALGGDAGGRKDAGIFNLWQCGVRWELNTLDNPSLPTSGTSLHASSSGVAGHYSMRSDDTGLPAASRRLRWAQIGLGATHFLDRGRYFSLGASLEALLSTRRLLPTYQASIVAAPALHPTPSSYNNFSDALRANSYLSLQVEPVAKITNSLQVRGTLNGFMPMRAIRPVPGSYAAAYGRWLHDPQFFGEMQVCFKLPLGTISAYANYTTGSVGWNFGLSLGTFILAPSFLEF